MSDVVIRVEDLSKKYIIGHNQQRGYKTLREVITSSARSLTHLFHTQTSKQEAQYEEFWALKDVSFEVKRGEVIGIIGRNGAGKSTLLKILSRITEPTTGEIRIKGRIASLLEVGTGFHPELTGRENIFLNGAILGMRKAEITQKFDEIVDFSGVEKFIDTPVKHYSSGMYTRLAFAVAAHLQPEILLIDEVLAVGDIEFQKKCIGKMESVAKEGRTIVVVSHSVTTVKTLCSSAILLENGQMRDNSSVDSVIAGYLNGNQPNKAEIIINDIDHEYSRSNIINIKWIRLLNSATGAFNVYWKQTICLMIELEALNKIDDVSFGIGIRMLDNSFVLVVYNDDNHQPKWSFEKGTYNIEIKVENNLKPGLYKLHVGAYINNAILNNVFALDAAKLEILNFTEQGIIPPASNPGLIDGIKSEFFVNKK